jgi:hypothetical protein
MTESGVGKRFPLVWWFIGGAALVSVLFYRDFIFYPGRMLAGSDMLLEGYPLRKFYTDELIAGRGVPMWTPHIYGGMPYVGLLPGPIFYPTTLLYFLLPLYRAIGWTFVLHTFVGAVFAYFMGRSFRLRPWSSAVCGASFMLTGYMTSHLFGGQDGRLFAMALIPFVFGSLERALRTNDLRWYCVVAVTVAFQIFTPHIQVVYFSSLTLSLYLLFHLVVRVRKSGEGRGDYLRPLGLFSLTFLVAAGIGAVQLLPTLSLLDHVVRPTTEAGYAFAGSWALPPQEVSAFILPDLIGSLDTYWGQNPIKLHTEYLGVVPIALSLLALASSVTGILPRYHRTIVWFLVGASTLAVLFALGPATPIHRIAYSVFPMISSFRAPSMMLAPFITFVALSAGLGWEAVLSDRKAFKESEERPGRAPLLMVLTVLGLPILLFGLAASVNPNGLLQFVQLSWYEPGWAKTPDPVLEAGVRLGGLFVLVGFALAWGVGLAVARRRLSQLAVIVLIVFILWDAWRISVRYLPVAEVVDSSALADDMVLKTLREEARPGERVWACGRACGFFTYRENRFMYDGVSSATGNQKFLLKSYARLLGGSQPDQGLLTHLTLIPFLGVKYLIAATPQSGIELLAEEPGRFLYRIPVPPHAYFPTNVRLLADKEEAVAATWQNQDPLSLAVLEPGPEREVPSPGQGVATVTHYEPDMIEFDVTVDAGGLLVVSEIYHPGWHAYVDDVETPIWQTNIAFRGIVVPKGEHRVRFVFESVSFRVGSWVTLLSSLLVASVLICQWHIRRARGGGLILE